MIESASPAGATEGARVGAPDGVPGRAPVRSWAGRAAALPLGEFLRFGVVGTVGFLIDVGVLTLALPSLGPWLGRAVSFLVAATGTYLLNRAWTFRASGGRASVGQWSRFLVVNLLGFAINYGTYALLVATLPVVAALPQLGVAAGSLAGLLSNFPLSRRFVFAPVAGRAGTADLPDRV